MMMPPAMAIRANAGVLLPRAILPEDRGPAPTSHPPQSDVTRPNAPSRYLMLLLTPDETKRALIDKESNELSLATNLLRIIGESTAIMGALREAARLGLDVIIKVWEAKPDIVYPFIAGEKFLKLWQPNQSPGGDVDLKAPASVLNKLKGLLANVASLSATNCNDFTRLFGTFIEKSGGSELAEIVKINTITAKDWESFRIAYRSPWAGTPFHASRRVRVGAKRSVPKAILDLLNTLGQGDIDTATRGVSMNTLLPGSTVRAMDRLFGLPEGADISGTTADALFTLETLLSCTAEKYRLATASLLPLAAMVSQYHHTILESALTLTMNESIEYEVGFYSTLFPKVSAAPTGMSSQDRTDLDKAHQKLKEAMAEAEASPKNLHMLVFEVAGGERRALVFDKEAELTEFRGFARMTQQRYDYFDGDRPVASRPLRELASFKAEDVMNILADVRRFSKLAPWEQEIERLVRK